MDIWAAGCIFAELLTRRAFLQVKNLLVNFFIGIHPAPFKTKKCLYAEKLMSMAKSLFIDDALTTCVN